MESIFQNTRSEVIIRELDVNEKKKKKIKHQIEGDT